MSFICIIYDLTTNTNYAQERWRTFARNRMLNEIKIKGRTNISMFVSAQSILFLLSFFITNLFLLSFHRSLYFFPLTCSYSNFVVSSKRRINSDLFLFVFVSSMIRFLDFVLSFKCRVLQMHIHQFICLFVCRCGRCGRLSYVYLVQVTRYVVHLPNTRPMIAHWFFILLLETDTTTKDPVKYLTTAKNSGASFQFWILLCQVGHPSTTQDQCFHGR